VSTAAPLIRGMDFVFVPITDFARSEAFYGGVLGLECSVRYPGDRGGEFETGNMTIMLLDVAVLGREFTPTGGAIALHVDDVAAARAELESRGVSFHGDIVDSGVCHQAILHDPDGNALSLHHRYAPRG